MMRIKTINYTYEGQEYCPFTSGSKRGSTDRGMVEFTVAGDDTKYYMKVDVDSRHDILNNKGWDYSELEELRIDYEVGDTDTPVEIDVNHIIKLPIKELYLKEAKIKGQPDRARIKGDENSDKYVWDNVLMYLPTLETLTIVGDQDIIYSLDFTYNPSLRDITLVNMELRDVKGYDTHGSVYMRLINCDLNEDTGLALMKYTMEQMKHNKGASFSLELATEW